MEVTYRLTRGDHQHFCKLALARVAEHAKRVSGWQANPTLVSLASGLLTVLALAYLAFGRLLDDVGVIVAGLAYIWGLLSMQLCGWYWRRQYWPSYLADDSPSLAEVRVKLDSDGIQATSAVSATRYNWQGIKQLSEADDLIIIWIDRGQGVVIPKGAFASQEARQGFIGTVRERIVRAPA